MFPSKKERESACISIYGLTALHVEKSPMAEEHLHYQLLELIVIFATYGYPSSCLCHLLRIPAIGNMIHCSAFLASTVLIRSSLDVC